MTCAENSTRLWAGNGPGIIYLIGRDDGLFKIGHTSEFKDRYLLVKYENRGYELKVVHAEWVHHRRYAEQFWHRYFADKRIWREWFRLSEEDINVFCIQG